MNTVPIYESPVRDRNINKYGDNGDNCECCMKPIKNTKVEYFFHACTDWEAMPNDATEEQIEEAGLESQGCFPVGSECAKKFPKGYIFKKTQQ